MAMGFSGFTAAEKFEMHLIQGCCVEAERTNRVALELDGLRESLSENFHGHMTAVVEEMRTTARRLRQLADLSQVWQARVAIVLNYLNTVLPCISKTLRDITLYYGDKALKREFRWRKMYNKMKDEADGMPLPMRFCLYNEFLKSLRLLLMKSPHFDLNQLEALHKRILRLREQRGIPIPPVSVGPQIRPEQLMLQVYRDSSVHWAEQIFTVPLPSRTAFRRIKQSLSFPPWVAIGQSNIPPNSRMLMKRSFDQDKLCLMVLLNASNGCIYFLLRTVRDGSPWFSLRGVHELCIERNNDGSALKLSRWSQSEQRAKLWASLSFLTWEELVLFYCTFVALKARNNMTLQVDPREFALRHEERLFQAQINDDGYKHSLIVYRDVRTGGLRLHAAVWEGELRECPVWTGFVGAEALRAGGWCVRARRSRHRVWLRQLQPYVFCERYRQHHQRRARGAFELEFAHEAACRQFVDLFAELAPAVDVLGAPNADADADADAAGGGGEQ